MGSVNRDNNIIIGEKGQSLAEHSDKSHLAPLKIQVHPVFLVILYAFFIYADHDLAVILKRLTQSFPHCVEQPSVNTYENNAHYYKHYKYCLKPVYEPLDNTKQQEDQNSC